jgi:hypothetical protein
MLLLIITVVIAAIVSSYASNLSETKSTSPHLIISPEIYRDDTLVYMYIPVLSAGNGIQTRDLRIITEWQSYDTSGGSSVVGGRNTDIYPTGYGEGVQSDEPGATDFGNYPLLGGTLMYVDTSEGCKALFGDNWNDLHEGDLVTLKIIHTLSQATIVNQNIVVRKINEI